MVSCRMYIFLKRIRQRRLDKLFITAPGLKHFTYKYRSNGKGLKKLEPKS